MAIDTRGASATVEVRASIGGGSKVRTYPAAYSAARAAWDADRENVTRARGELRAERDHAKRALDNARRDTEAADRQKSTGARMRNRYDSDTRAIGAGRARTWS